MAAPRYVGTDAASAVAYVREVIGDPNDFLRVFDRDNDGEVAPGSSDERALVMAVCAAETEVDEVLAASHGAPFPPGAVPESVRQIAALRSLWCAMRTRPLSDAERGAFRTLYKDTDARLAKLRDDAGARIPQAAVPAPASVLLAQPDPPPTPWNDAATRRTWNF